MWTFRRGLHAGHPAVALVMSAPAAAAVATTSALAMMTQRGGASAARPGKGTASAKLSAAKAAGKAAQQQQQQQQQQQPSKSVVAPKPTPTASQTSPPRTASAASATAAAPVSQPVRAASSASSRVVVKNTQPAPTATPATTAAPPRVRPVSFIAVQEAQAAQQAANDNASNAHGDGSAAAGTADSFASSGLRSHSGAAMSSSTTMTQREVLNRISWIDVQQKVQTINGQLASCRPHAASEILNNARQLVRGIENTFVFVAEPKVCIAAHEDPLTVSIAIDLINAALRFSLPVTSSFIQGLFCFIVSTVPAASASSSAAAQSATASEATSAAAPRNGFLHRDNVAHLLQVVNGSTTVSALNVWDERVFERCRGALAECMGTATLRVLVGLLNALGSKEIGMPRSRGDGHQQPQSPHGVASASGHADSGDVAAGGTAGDSGDATAANGAAIPPQAAAAVAAARLTPSVLLPTLFTACLDRVGHFVRQAIASADAAAARSEAANGRDNEHAAAAGGDRLRPSTQPLDSIIDAICAFADSAVAADPDMRACMRGWITALVARAPASHFESLLLAASTMRLDGVFYLALHRAWQLQAELPRAALAKLPTSVMLLPHRPPMQLSVVMRPPAAEARADKKKGDDALHDSDANAAAATVFFEPAPALLTVADVAIAARRHLWDFAGVANGAVTGAASRETRTFEVLLSPRGSAKQPVLLDPRKTLAQYGVDSGAAFIVREAPPAGERTTAAGGGAGGPSPVTLTASDMATVKCATAVDALLFAITDSLVGARAAPPATPATPATAAAQPPPSAASPLPLPQVCTDLTFVLAGTIALGLSHHTAALSASSYFADAVATRAFLPDQVAQVTAELEYLAFAPHFRGADETRELLATVMAHVRHRLRAVARERGGAAHMLTCTQLRLLCCSALAVRHELPADVATFLLANLVELVGTASLADIAAVLYSVGRAGVAVPESSHAAIARRIGVVLKFARASKRFASATAGRSVSEAVGASSTGSSGSVSSVGGTTTTAATTTTHEITAHDLAVVLCGLHLTQFRWDTHASLFNDIAGAILWRRKRYTPAQCCQLVAIARDIARAAQQRSNAALNAEAVKLARAFLPQVRLTIPSATHGDVLPLLAWLSTGHIRDVALLGLIVERLIALHASTAICLSVLESVHVMGLLGGISSDAVFRLMAMVRPNADPEQSARLAFYMTQLRARDADLVRLLIARARECTTAKALCSAIGALSVIQAPEADLRHFTQRLEAALSAASATGSASVSAGAAAAATAAHQLHSDPAAMPSVLPPLGANLQQQSGGAAAAAATRGGGAFANSDIDVECLVAAMTALAANSKSAAAERTRFLNLLCAPLDAQLSQLPALRSHSTIAASIAASGTTTSAAASSSPHAGDADQGDGGDADARGLHAAISMSSTRSVPVGPLANLLSALAAHNLPVFAVFRACGKCFVAPGAVLHMTPHDAVKALSAYAAFGFRDDLVVRALAGRCVALRSSIAKKPILAARCCEAMAVFHIPFDLRGELRGGSDQRQLSTNRSHFSGRG